jgi:hypothetical protein
MQPEGGSVTIGMRNYLTALSEQDRRYVARDSREALRLAWPHRQSLRGRIVVQSNCTMLRSLRNL